MASLYSFCFITLLTFSSTLGQTASPLTAAEKDEFVTLFNQNRNQLTPASAAMRTLVSNLILEIFLFFSNTSMTMAKTSQCQ